MKKTTTISIAQQLFHVEEDAFVLLDEYLASIKQYFTNQSGANDIISDIEFRIAEHFSSQHVEVITKEIAQQVIDTMGTVEQFADGPTEKITKSEKKLYRDADGKIIAGVASGLAQYFGISRLFVRILFAVSIFFGGFGIALYIVLWIAIPEAKTSVQKLEMQGEEATLKAMSAFVRDGYTKARNTFEQDTHHFFVRVAAVCKKLLGLFAVVGSFLFAIVLSVLTILGLTKIPAQLIGNTDVVLSGIITNFYFGATIVFGFFVFILPTIIVFLWGIDLVWKKQTLKKVSSLAFLSIWFISIVLAGVSGAQVISQYVKLEKEVYQTRYVRQEPAEIIIRSIDID